MGIGASKGQGSEATYEKQDVEKVSADKSNWPELAGAKLAESNGLGQKPHIDAHNVGPNASRADEDDAGSDDEVNEVNTDVQVNTLRQRKPTSNGVQSKSSLLNVGALELDERSQSPLPSHSTRELAGSPEGSLPCTNVQKLVEQREAENLEELRRLAADLDHRLELQIQKSRDQRSGPIGALFGPRIVRPTSGSGPTSGFYETQVVRSKLEQGVRGCGPTDNSSVVRPVMDQDQQNNAYCNAAGAN